MVKIAVLGCGLMGVKIAGELAYHGHRVKVYDSNMNSLNTVFERMEEDKRYLRTEGLLTHKNFIGQILCMSRLEETVSDADFIFEAVVDDLDVKQDLFERVSHLCKKDAVIATNTLRLDGAAVVARTSFQERTTGLRFLFPVYYIPEVEITPNTFTSPATIEKVRLLLEKMGKTLFFRSGGEPLILSEDQREERKRARLEQIRNSSGMTYFFESTLPALSHRGNNAPPPDDEEVVYRSEHDHDCAICMDRNRDCVLCPCHHMITCHECSKMLLNRRDGCPICRKDISEVIPVYLS
ncbi:LOW QUALITY PROTEIN: 3-hydroxybutyryl-CoA dehydrogenase-like [Liolophura sinensis]|uniref:LOW QUALITY PROTEIN: 3-hydroxybutyryl-CoA dehydrogenase-like n=1 Tax=Liolophura sinensis TaxID=3198878 RepID=UPI00315888B6